MIAYCIEENKTFTIRIRAGRTQVRILDYDAYILAYDGSVRLIVAEPLYFSLLQPIEDGSVHIISKRDCKYTCRIFYVLSTGGFDLFSKYSFDSRYISIGCSRKDTICLNNRNIKSSQITIDLYEKTVSDKLNQNIISINHMPMHDDRFEYGDMIQIFNLCLSVQPFGILINSGDNIRHKLEPIQEIEAKAFLRTGSVKEVERKCLAEYFCLGLEEDIPEYENLPAENDYPLLFSIGPILTMSSASLIAGILNGYSSYMKGRELIDIVPMLLLPSIMIFSTLLWNPLQRLYEKRKIKKAVKKRLITFESDIEGMKNRYDDLASHWIKNAAVLFPSNKEISDFIRTDEILWQKDRNREDWLIIKAGIGNRKRNISIANANTIKKADPIYSMMTEFMDDPGCTENIPILLDFQKIHSCVIESIHYTDRFFITLFLQMCILFGPDQLQIAIICSPTWLQKNEWIRSIPHLFEKKSMLRMIAVNQKQASVILDCLNKSSKETILIIQNHQIEIENQPKNAHTVYLADEKNMLFNNCSCRITVEEEYALMKTDSKEEIKFKYEKNNVDLLSFAQWISNRRILQCSEGLRVKPIGFFDLYQIANASDLKITQRWEYSKTRNMIEAPIGIDEHSEVISINLHEKANGPHGLIAGTTGSGKSELIVTLILSLSVNYSCREIQFVIIDFKGGGISNIFDNEIHHLPHLAGSISNLNENNINRTSVSFKNEIQRRETLLKKLSDFIGIPIMNTDAYQKYWTDSCGLPYMCHLVIIIDEFAEMKKECPQFLNDMISMARVGRSLGIHLILCTQKPAGVVDEQIWSNSRFKICLKVQDDTDSMEIIHRKDASSILNPGTFYMLCDGKLQYGYAAYSHAPLSDRTVSILNEMMQINNSAAQKRDDDKTQIRAVMDSIMTASENENMAAYPLWLNHLNAEMIENIEEDRLIIGRTDDYYHRSQQLLFFQPQEDHNAVFFSIERQEKIELLHILMYGLMNITDKNDEIFVIDDLGCGLESYMQCAQTADILMSDQKEKIENLLKHLNDRNHCSESSAHVVITHITSFYESSEGNALRLNALLELSSQKNLHFYLFCNAASSIRYKDLSSIPFRVSLYNENLQDVRSIFETSEKAVQNKKHYGLVRKDRIIEFRMPILTEEQEINRIVSTVNRCGNEKHYRIPYLKEHILRSEYKGIEIGIGINVNNYHWVELSPFELHLILATEIDELQWIYDIYKNCLNALWRPCKSITEDLIMHKKAALVFMLYQDFQNSILDNHESVKTIVYAGKGFSRQYRFSMSGKQELKSNQGAVFRNGRAEVIQIAENE